MTASAASPTRTSASAAAAPVRRSSRWDAISAHESGIVGPAQRGERGVHDVGLRIGEQRAEGGAIEPRTGRDRAEHRRGERSARTRAETAPSRVRVGGDLGPDGVVADAAQARRRPRPGPRPRASLARAAIAARSAGLPAAPSARIADGPDVGGRIVEAVPCGGGRRVRVHRHEPFERVGADVLAVVG